MIVSSAYLSQASQRQRGFSKSFPLSFLYFTILKQAAPVHVLLVPQLNLDIDPCFALQYSPRIEGDA
jgi:hypothetical protein